MSPDWNLAVPPAPAGNIEAVIEQAISGRPEELPEVTDQIDLAVELALAAVKSGFVGRGVIQVAANGHAEPKHESVAERPEFVAISIIAQPTPVAAPVAAEEPPE